ncbi:PQQ-binding-like beta-propeller repeat protein [Nocardia sp. NPDC058058]|uniref:outer membrane protein assembly factor BamB family protein n=1 Tax=Nocardia sp. NPDC058058 TaxID=3346317 RepID=UPI0036DA83D1
MRIYSKTPAAALLAAGLLLGVAGCAPTPATRIATAGVQLDVPAAAALTLPRHDAIGTTAYGVYLLANGELRGIDPHGGSTKWTVRKSDSVPEAGGITSIDARRTLLVKWRNQPGMVAYSAETGTELWSTTADTWSETTLRDGRFVRNDPGTGAERWTIELTALGCADPALDPPTTIDPELLHHMAAPAAYAETAVTTYRCRTAPYSSEWMVGALDSATGAKLWDERVRGSMHLFGHQPGNLLRYGASGAMKTVDALTGRALLTDSFTDDLQRDLLPDGSVLAANTYRSTVEKFLRVEDADGGIRWTVPLTDENEKITVWDGHGIGNTVLAMMTELHGTAGWLLAFDMRTGARTVVAGPGPTARGEHPLLELGVLDTSSPSVTAPWGVLISGAYGDLMTIPVK